MLRRPHLYVLILLLFLGCQEDDGRVRVTVWHQKTGAERAFFERVVDEYNAGHPDRFVQPLYKETEELRSLYVIASVGGRGPDLVFGPSDNVSIMALTESIMPVDRVLSDDWLAQFNEGGVIRWEDRPWMVADQVGNHLTLVYNRKYIPEPPETMSEMVALLRGLVGKDGIQYGLTWNSTEPFFFVPFLTCFGGWVMDEQGDPMLDSPATVNAINFILHLREEGLIPGSTDYDTAETLFKEEKVPAIINGPWSWSGYSQAGIDYGIARIPRMDETGLWCAPMISSKGYSVNVNLAEEKVPFVREVLEFLTSPDMQLSMAVNLSTIPVIDSLRALDTLRANPVLQASLLQVEVSRPMPTQPQMRQYWDGMRGPYQEVMSGSVTPEAGARMMQEQVEKRIADTFL